MREHQTKSNSVSSPVLNTREAAIYIDRSEAFLHASRIKNPRTAGPPCIRMGRSIGYLKSDLDDWLVSLRDKTPTRGRLPITAEIGHQAALLAAQAGEVLDAAANVSQVAAEMFQPARAE